MSNRGSIPGRVGEGIIFFTITSSRSALGYTQPLIQLIPWIKRPEHEADHSPQSSDKVKNAWIYTSILPISHQGMILCVVVLS